MNQLFASIDLSDVALLDADSASLTFIEDAEFEFVGGGTAVNSL
jgi:hypothetical protein